jgi:methionine-rich copper-binding protein CopC
MITMRRIAVFAVLIAAAAFVPAESEATAERHLRLLKSEPAAEAMLDAAPKAIHLWFSEAPEARVTTVRVTAPGSEPRKIENVSVDSEDATHIIAEADSLAGPGAYTIAWRTMSRDGHVVSGEVAFEVRPQH